MNYIPFTNKLITSIKNKHDTEVANTYIEILLHAEKKMLNRTKMRDQVTFTNYVLKEAAGKEHLLELVFEVKEIQTQTKMKESKTKKLIQRITNLFIRANKSERTSILKCISCS